MKQILTIVLLVTIALVSCNKEKNIDVQILNSKENIDNLNAFKPDRENLSGIYHSFKKEVVSQKKDYLKDGIEPIDRTVDEAVWLIETMTNTELGFRNDSIDELLKDSHTFILQNKSFTPEGIPVIDGNDLVDLYEGVESIIQTDEQTGHMFWLTEVTITEITTEQTTIEVLNTGGPKGINFVMPMAPGFDPEPFPAGTQLYLGWPGYNSYGYADYEYFLRIRKEGQVGIAPGYIVQLYSSFFKSHYILPPYQWEERIAHGDLPCQIYIVEGSEVNEFLFGEKEVIDENNPISNPNLFIGIFGIDCYDPPEPIFGRAGWHHIGFYIYETTWIGYDE